MAEIPMHDFGTVRLFETNGIVEAYFPFGDAVTKGVVKGLKGRFEGTRKAWRVDPRFAGKSTSGIVDAIRTALVDAAPEPWRAALPTFSRLSATTRDYSIRLGEGGMRLEIPPGHKHEYTLKSLQGASREGRTWLVPAAMCADDVVKRIIGDVVTDDRKALAEALDYMENFVLTGALDLVEGEAEAVGLTPGTLVYADPSFVRKVDDSMTREPLREYVFRVGTVTPTEAGTKVTLAFVTGREGWNALRERLASPYASRSATLDVRHATGKWSRRRG